MLPSTTYSTLFVWLYWMSLHLWDLYIKAQKFIWILFHWNCQKKKLARKFHHGEINSKFNKLKALLSANSCMVHVCTGTLIYLYNIPARLPTFNQYVAVMHCTQYLFQMLNDVFHKCMTNRMCIGLTYEIFFYSIIQCHLNGFYY